MHRSDADDLLSIEGSIRVLRQHRSPVLTLPEDRC